MDNDKKLEVSEDADSAKEHLRKLFAQVDKIAQAHEKKLITRTPNDPSEYMQAFRGPEQSTLLFSTEKFNIASPEEPENAYPNTFTFVFEPASLLLTYMEALSRREQTVRINETNFPDLASFKEAIMSSLDKINLLLEYFHLVERVKW